MTGDLGMALIRRGKRSLPKHVINMKRAVKSGIQTKIICNSQVQYHKSLCARFKLKSSPQTIILTSKPPNLSPKHFFFFVLFSTLNLLNKPRAFVFHFIYTYIYIYFCLRYFFFFLLYMPFFLNCLVWRES